MVSAPKQGSDEWLQIRARSINASTSLVWEGEHPFETTESVMRSQIREMAGVPSEFVMSPPVRHGTEHEADAIACYERESGAVCSSDFSSIPHQKYSFLRGSPDSLVGLTGGVEAKCPYRRKTPYSVFDEDKKHYLWQCYTVMEVCDIDWIDFICWISDTNFKIERVNRRTGFLEEKVSATLLPQPREGDIRRIDLWQTWHNHMMNEHQDPELRKKYIGPKNLPAIYTNSDEQLDRLTQIQSRISYFKNQNEDVLNSIDSLEKESGELKKEIADRYGESVTNGSVVVQVIKKTPPIDYKEAFEFLGGSEAVLAKGENLEKFRKTNNTRQVSIKQYKEDADG